MSFKSIIVVIVAGVCAALAIDEGAEPALEHAPLHKAGETVLKVEYERGMIKGLYVAQMGGVTLNGDGGGSSVDSEKAICEDLCTAGLGGTPCGWDCEAALPAGLASTGNKKKITITIPHRPSVVEHKPISLVPTADPVVDQTLPRTGVCPTLCSNGLGQPLCNCTSTTTVTSFGVHWKDVCSSFCLDQYHLKGCPECGDQDMQTRLVKDAKSDDNQPSDMWIEWCKVQCKMGQGGAACRCDMITLG